MMRETDYMFNSRLNKKFTILSLCSMRRTNENYLKKKMKIISVKIKSLNHLQLYLKHVSIGTINSL